MAVLQRHESNEWEWKITEKWGFNDNIFPPNTPLIMSEIALQVAAKIASCNMALRYDILLYNIRQVQRNDHAENVNICRLTISRYLYKPHIEFGHLHVMNRGQWIINNRLLFMWFIYDCYSLYMWFLMKWNKNTKMTLSRGDYVMFDNNKFGNNVHYNIRFIHAVTIFDENSCRQYIFLFYIYVGFICFILYS